MQKSLIIDNSPGSKYASDSKADSLFIQVAMRILTGVDCNIANQINVRLKLTMSAQMPNSQWKWQHQNGVNTLLMYCRRIFVVFAVDFVINGCQAEAPLYSNALCYSGAIFAKH